MNPQIEDENLKVSVIIPVYNAEKYLARCLKAVLEQTYKDLEIILINDGSEDGSGDIIRSFDDERIVVIEKENGGVSAARNDGLRRVSGTHVVFVDADDYPEPDYVEKMADAMKRRLRRDFYALRCGFTGAPLLLNVLLDCGLVDEAYRILLSEEYPGWLYEILHGATTIWERWNSLEEDGRVSDTGMDSFNHYAYGCVCEWIWETAAGIAADPKMPGFKHIIMAPVPDKRLGHLTAEYKSAAGTIKSAWKYNGDRWTWKFTIPEGATATVTLPGETESKDYKAGKYTVEV